MNKNFDKTNNIHPTAIIEGNVIIGKYNNIGKNVIIQGFKGDSGEVVIGDCNIINDGTRILASPYGIFIGDWNIFHNNMLIMGEKKMSIGHTCWFGQNTILDSSGELEIGNGVRVGMYSQIWTHVASGELIEGCTLFGDKKTTIEDEVWLVGSCIVSSGIVLSKRSICLSGSNITKSTEKNKVYAGSPAKIIEKLNFYKSVTLDDKFGMMLKWVKEFIAINQDLNFTYTTNTIEIFSKERTENIIITKGEIFDKGMLVSVFSLSSKKFTKRLTPLELSFYKYIFGYKARFLPV